MEPKSETGRYCAERRWGLATGDRMAENNGSMDELSDAHALDWLTFSASTKTSNHRVENRSKPEALLTHP